MDHTEAHRAFFAKLMAAQAGVSADSPLAQAFAVTPREKFLGASPWKVFARSGYLEVASGNPELLYQDVVISLNKGQLVGESGSVDAYEIDAELAANAQANLADLSQVKVHPTSGAVGTLPECDVLYVNASATHPLPTWLDALRPNGRLLFPLAPENGPGAMLLISHREDGTYSARFVMPVQFIPCIDAQDNGTSANLASAFRRANLGEVMSLHRNNSPDDTAWVARSGWWLSTRNP